LISSSEAGFSKPEVSPSFSPKDAAHHFRVSRFGMSADEQHFLVSERFVRLDGERVFKL
jgi:hypothetical protein